MSNRDGQLGSNEPPEERQCESAAGSGPIEPRLYAELRAYLAALLRDWSAADDVLQAVCLKWTRRQFDADGDQPAQRAWLFRAAHNEGIDWKRRQSREDRLLRRGDWWHRPEGQTPEQELLRREQIERVGAAIDQLPADQREVVRRRIHDGQTFAQIASDLQIPLGTVLTRMRLATERLRRGLRDEIEP